MRNKELRKEIKNLKIVLLQIVAEIRALNYKEHVTVDWDEIYNEAYDDE